jgi:hypothetical protein
MAMDRKGDIGIGYSFGGDPNYPGQRFAARMANDPKGQLTIHESVLAGGPSIANWQLALGGLHQHHRRPLQRLYLLVCRELPQERRNIATTRIGSFALPGCK